jgi:quercetin dioxygenase-like cupin family protein
MRHLALAFLVLGCSSGAKQPANPMPPDPGMAAGEPGGEPAVKAEPPPPPPPDTGGYRLVAPSSLSWSPLDPNNPAGPHMAPVTGDPQQGAGFFLRLPPGTNAGLHTHTADYHAIVVSGAPRHWLPGEDKKAKPLGAGSYWFQPGNQPHGDECTGTEPCLLYIVMNGAFDFAPAPKAKAVKPGKYHLVARKDMKFGPMDPSQPAGLKLAIVSGDPKTGPVAFIIEIPPGTNAGLHSHTSEYHALAIEGTPAHWLPHEANEGAPVESGTYWFQPGGYDHGDRCTGTAPCRVFVMMPKALDALPPKKM